jgi:hypothetical protein
MGKGRRLGVLAATVAAGISLTATPTAAGAAPRVTGPRPVTQLLPTVDPHDPTWVGVRWTTDRRVCDVKVTVWGNRNVRVDYAGRSGYASFRRSDTLRPGRTDITAFRVTARFDKAVWVILAATITYDHCGRNSPTLTRNTGLLLPVRGDQLADT